jgi:hypothetical protein
MRQFTVGTVSQIDLRFAGMSGETAAELVGFLIIIEKII